ncbi:MAG TPA: diguanylate cyclase [Pyrinomonadaceae bacterium]|nr:diguanylate cyclase [Pyrinomonadaceae bacterium]
MKDASSPTSSWQSRILSMGVIGVAICAVALSALEVISTTDKLSRIGVLLASLFVSVLVSRYELRVPGTQIRFSAKDIFAFWGVMWLGVSGGILIGAGASIANHAALRNDRKRFSTEVAVDVLAIFFAAIMFYLAFEQFKSEGQIVLAGGFSVPHETAIAACVMAVSHFAYRCALTHLLRQTDYETIRANFIGAFRKLALVGTISFVATLLLFVVFSHFGIELGLIFIPLAIVSDLSYQIHVRRLEQKTKLISESSRIHLATVEALATAIDARDQVGIGHVRRTQIYAMGMGNILGLSEDDINAIRTGALLHDIGKLAVPDHILNKPGRLTPAEMEKIKTHSLVGASILEKVGFPYPVVPTVKYHHEFWDGCGYPEGLRGDNIPLTARILSIADAYDTLRIARPYRGPVVREEACNFLRSRAGTQFDPRLVDVFLRNLKIFESEIQAQHLAYPNELEAIGVSNVILGGASPNYVEQIKRANREVFTLYSLAREFSSALDLDEILSLFTEKVRELVPFDTSVVYLLDETGEYARAVYAEGRNKATLSGRRIRLGEGPTGEVLKNCLPCENVDPALEFQISHTDLADQYEAMASIPLVAEERLIGAISIYTSEISHYQDEHLRLLETLSRIAAEAIGKSLEHAVTENYALTDPMTGLPNPRSLQLQFEKEVKRASRNEGSFQVLVLDLDRFKAVNDTHGHKVGDRMLKEIGNVIKNQLREYDFLARYGGDEFIAIVPDTDNTDALELVRRIEESVHGFTLTVGDDQMAQVGVSIGTACYPIHGETFDQIITSADKAMYLAKSFHRKRAEEVARGANADLIDATISRPTMLDAVPEEIMEFATVKGVLKDGLILEVEETHIVSSSAVN